MDSSCGAFSFSNNVCTLLKTEFLYKAGTDLTEVFIRDSVVRGNLFNTWVFRMGILKSFEINFILVLARYNTKFLYFLQKMHRGPHGHHGMDVGMIDSLLMALKPPPHLIYASQLTVTPIKTY